MDKAFLDPWRAWFSLLLPWSTWFSLLLPAFTVILGLGTLLHLSFGARPFLVYLDPQAQYSASTLHDSPQAVVEGDRHMLAAFSAGCWWRGRCSKFEHWQLGICMQTVTLFHIMQQIKITLNICQLLLSMTSFFFYILQLRNRFHSYQQRSHWAPTWSPLEVFFEVPMTSQNKQAKTKTSRLLNKFKSD